MCTLLHNPHNTETSVLHQLGVIHNVHPPGSPQHRDKCFTPAGSHTQCAPSSIIPTTQRQVFYTSWESYTMCTSSIIPTTQRQVFDTSWESYTMCTLLDPHNTETSVLHQLGVIHNVHPPGSPQHRDKCFTPAGGHTQCAPSWIPTTQRQVFYTSWESYTMCTLLDPHNTETSVYTSWGSYTMCTLLHNPHNTETSVLHQLGVIHNVHPPGSPQHRDKCFTPAGSHTQCAPSSIIPTTQRQVFYTSWESYTMCTLLHNPHNTETSVLHQLEVIHNVHPPP
ncbi:hypothetical protein BaRGS_00010726 [Batillaria attramentaria]|uniref:Uncharacterized protein n=1 Tax=Batillaria attramentaria TaxID=370345 RepID=A0ABD0LG75_9CAEN